MTCSGDGITSEDALTLGRIDHGGCHEERQERSASVPRKNHCLPVTQIVLIHQRVEELGDREMVSVLTATRPVKL